MRYPPVIEGEWFEPQQRNFKLACCDCGLVHRFNFKAVNKRARLQIFRDNRSTAAKRRYNKMAVVVE